MPAFICRTCGVQHAESESPPERCIICEDERQYVGRGGQQWMTLEEMRAGSYENRFVEVQPNLTALFTTPRFAIGQRALIVQTANGNFMWDAITYIDDPTVEGIRALAGISAISVSHPHFYDSMVEYGRAFEAPVYIPEADRQWVTRPDPLVQYYEGKIEPLPGLTLLQVGGHFEGSGVLHWADGADGKGAILTGDSISVAADTRWVTFMRSYPNYIPLPEVAVRRIVDTLEPYEFEHVYGGWMTQDVLEDGKAVVKRSAERYIEWTRRQVDP